jgi:hypothetical protein
MELRSSLSPDGSLDQFTRMSEGSWGVPGLLGLLPDITDTDLPSPARLSQTFCAAAHALLRLEENLLKFKKTR